MKICQDLYIDKLYDFTNKEGKPVERFLITFYGEGHRRYDIEMDLIDEMYMEFIPYESDEIDGEDRLHLLYLLDRWAINYII